MIVPIVTAANTTTDPIAVRSPAVVAARKTGRIVRSGEAAAPNGTITAASPLRRRVAGLPAWRCSCSA